MATDNQKLVVQLEARIRDFEKKMDRAQKKANTSLQRIEKQATRSSRRMTSQMSAGANGLAAVFTRLQGVMAASFAGVSAAAMVREFRRATAAVAELNKEASVSGLDTQAFQEFQIIGRKFKISQDAITDGFKELNLRADEFVQTGAGPAKEAFQRLGYDAQTLAQKLETPDQLFAEIIEKLRSFDDAAQIRILDEVFGGTGGEQFAALLRDGADSIADLRREARNSGQVLSKELIDKATELDRRLEDVSRTLETRWRSAMINAGSATFGFIDAIDDALGKLDELMTHTGNTLGRYSTTIGLLTGKDISDLNQWMAEQGWMNNDGLRILDEDLANAAQDNAVKETRKEIENLEINLDRVNKLMALPEGERGLVSLEALEQQAAELKRQLEGARDVLRALETGKIDFSMPFAERERLESILRGESTTYVNDSLRSRAAHERVNVDKLDEPVKQAVHRFFELFPQAQLTSAYRSPEYNESVGGASNSRHMHGDAVDIVGLQGPEQWAAAMDFLMGLGAKGFGWYNNGSMHADWREKPAAWGPDRTSGSLDQTPAWFQERAASLTGVQQATQRDQNAAAAEREADAVDRVIENLKFENEQLQRSALQRQIHAELRRAGVELNSEEGQRIAELVEKRFEHERAIQAENEALRQQRAAAKQTAKEVDSAGDAMAQLSNNMGNAFAGAFQGFISDLVRGKDAAEALRNALTRLADQLLSMVLNNLFGQLFGGMFGGGGFGLFSGGGAVEAASGGFIRGPGTGTSDSIPARLSDGEFVVRASQARKHGALLAAINEGKVAKYASGGFVGSTPSFASAANDNRGNVTISPTINIDVERSSGDPEQDAAYAKKIGDAVEKQVRSLVTDEIMQQQRNGGVLSRSGRGRF